MLSVNVDVLLPQDLAARDRLARQLRQEILDLEVDDVLLAVAPAPDLAKGLGSDLGNLLVMLANSTVLAALLDLIRVWAMRSRNRRVVIRYGELSLELSGADGHAQQKMIDDFLAAIARRENGGGESESESDPEDADQNRSVRDRRSTPCQGIDEKR